MSHHIPDVVTWCLAVALIAVAVLLVRQRGITAALRLRAATLEEGQRARDTELGHLTAVRLPAVTASMNQPVPLPGLLDEQLAGTVFAHGLQSVMDTFTQAVDKAQARADQSAKAALKASMRALQGLAHEQQLAISDMQDRHDNPDVLRDLLQIDHANSQFGRRAQAIAVLCGSWPGRQRAASPLTDVVRGATSRIRDYRRVQVHSQADLAVVSRAVEPVVLAVAELLDNAARHSQPNTTVEVGLQPVHNGACIVIDDAGVGMDGQEIQRAGALLTGRTTVDVSRLGDPPQFGFPVIGVLAARYGFSVSVDTRSPYGGVRAVLFLPSTLLTQIDIDGPDTTPLRPPGERDRGRGQARGQERGQGRGYEADRTAAPRPPGQAPVPDFPDFPDARNFPAASDVRDFPAASGFPSESDFPAAPDFPSVSDFPAAAARADRDRPTAAGSPAEPTSDTPGTSGSVPGSVGSTAGGLPKRRRRQPAAGSHRGRPAPLPAETPAPGTPGGAGAGERTAEETARRMGAFARGTRAGRTPAAGTPIGPLHGAPAPGAPAPDASAPDAPAHGTAPHGTPGTPGRTAHPFAPAPVDDEGNPLA
ncbi:ATP-binding protein [Streptomyces klenkii]|uniref:ATP-binding protein n=1 Tax=Streptomyces klenkii TaxID=1420899 RepID=UPI003403C215